MNVKSIESMINATWSLLHYKIYDCRNEILNSCHILHSKFRYTANDRPLYRGNSIFASERQLWHNCIHQAMNYRQPSGFASWTTDRDEARGLSGRRNQGWGTLLQICNYKQAVDMSAICNFVIDLEKSTQHHTFFEIELYKTLLERDFYLPQNIKNLKNLLGENEIIVFDTQVQVRVLNTNRNCCAIDNPIAPNNSLIEDFSTYLSSVPRNNLNTQTF